MAPPVQVDPPAFEYVVVDSCPSQMDARSLFPSMPGRTRVVAWYDGKSYGGTVSFQAPNGETAERTLNGPTCSVVLEALALSVQVTVDRDNATGHLEEPAPSTALRPTSLAAETSSEATEPSRSSGSFLRGFDIGVGAWFGGQPNIAPAANLALVIGGARQHESLWSPRLRLGTAASWPTRERAEEAALYSFLARFEGCPIEFGSASFSVSPCLRQHLGVLASTKTSSSFAAATGLSLLVQTSPRPMAPWYFLFDAAGLMPWVPYAGSLTNAQVGLSVGVSTQ